MKGKYLAITFILGLIVLILAACGQEAVVDTDKILAQKKTYVGSDPLGLGWDLLGTADMHFGPLIPDWIPVIQGLVLLTGLYLGVSRGLMGLRDVLHDRSLQIRAMVLPAAFALLAVNVLLKLYMG